MCEHMAEEANVKLDHRVKGREKTLKVIINI
jgi:hypothetical protein